MTEATQTIVERLRSIADAGRRDDGTDIPLGEQCREGAAEIERLQAALKPNLMACADAGFVETVTEDTLTVWQEIERPAFIEVGRNADGRIVGLRVYSREIADEINATEGA